MKTGRPKIEGLSPRQADTMQEICRYYDIFGSMPSMQEISRRFGIAVPSVFFLFKTLVEKGFLRKVDESRGVYEIARRVGKDAMVLAKVPLRGTIPCGPPVEPTDTFQGEMVLVDASIVRTGNFFALKLDGTSMCAIDYEAGDVVIIRHQPVAENGDIVASCLNGEATLKRLVYSPDRIALKWENGKRTMIEIGSTDRFSIIGKVVKHIKQKDLKYGEK